MQDYRLKRTYLKCSFEPFIEFMKGLMQRWFLPTDSH